MDIIDKKTWIDGDWLVLQDQNVKMNVYLNTLHTPKYPRIFIQMYVSLFLLGAGDRTLQQTEEWQIISIEGPTNLAFIHIYCTAVSKVKNESAI